MFLAPVRGDIRSGMRDKTHLWEVLRRLGRERIVFPGTPCVGSHRKGVLFGGFFVCVGIVCLSGCGAAKASGKAARIAGKAGYHTARAAGKTAVVVGKTTGGAAKTVVHIARGTQVVPLERQGGVLIAEVLVNRKVKARFLVDTGASQMQVSQALARRLNVDLRKAIPVPVRVAGGTTVAARSVTLKEVRIGRARVENVQAIVIDREGVMMYDGLLGMSFLSHFNFQVDTENSRLILRKRM